MVPAISALLAGNTVVLKPSEVTPITGELIAELMARVGLPEGVFQVIQGDGTTGAALSKADIDKLFFTGSVATGKKVMKAAAAKPIPVELELGGKDAMIVCEDANLERAARGAIWGGLINCGQMCTSVERIFVRAEIYDRFIALLEREVDKVKVGGPDADADMGPLTFDKQMETVEAHVNGAVEDGADLRRGGHRIEGKGQFYAPALITDVTPDMEIYKEETFGPVLPVIKVRSDDEAIRLANDHQYGLTGSVWTQDRERGLRIASAMECGQVMVNDVVISVGNPVLPFGGVKSSGFGRYHGPEGLLSFVHQKAIMADRGLLNSEPLWFPYAGKYEHVTKVFEGLLNNNMVKAVGNLIRMR
jgi:acyl-CoA reductase-like NAD-dependent aldehyde dehydrogenase